MSLTISKLQSLKNSHHLSRKFLTSILNVVCVLLTLEFCCHFFSNHSEQITRYEGPCRTFLPNLNIKRLNVESGRFIEIKTNSIGFREREPAIPKPDSVYRIAVLGDSYSAAVHVEKEERFTELLSKQLRSAYPNRHFEVLNFGVMGTGPVDQYNRYLRYVKQCEPDMVILVFTMEQDFDSVELKKHFEEHFAGTLHAALQNPQSESSPDAPHDTHLTDLIVPHSELYSWQKQKTDYLKHRLLDVGPLSWAREPELPKKAKYYFDSQPEIHDQTSENLSRLLKRFQETVRSDGGEFVLAGMPTGLNIYETTWSEFVSSVSNSGLDVSLSKDNPLKMVRSLCQKHEIPLIPLEELIDEGYKTGRIDSDLNLHFNQKGHLTVYGHQTVAEFLFDFISSEFPNSLELDRNPRITTKNLPLKH